MRSRYFFSVAMILLTGVVAGAAEQAALPSPGDIQKLVDGGQYRDALKDVTRVLALTGPAAAAYDRYDLLMFRAECELQIRQQAPALEALGESRKEAFAQAKPERAIAPTALTFLLQHSTVYQYVPKSAGGHKPIPWLDRARRQEAYAALLLDELPAAQKRVQMITRATSLVPVLELARTVGSLRALELSSTSDNSQAESVTKPLVTAAGDKAAQLIGDAVIDPSGKVSKISETANQLVMVNIPHYDSNSKRSWVTAEKQRRGLSGDDIQYLKNTGGLCEKLVAATTEISQALNADVDSLKATLANASTLKLRIVGLLTDDYTNTQNRSEKNLTTQP